MNTTSIPAPLEIAAKALTAAKQARSRDDFVDAPGPTIHLHGDVADALLIARGWTIEPQSRGGFRYVAPDGVTFYWHRDDALTMALTAEGFALGVEA